MSNHSLVSLGARHPVHDFDFANAAARLGASVSSTDVGKVARQLDDNSFWVLQSTAPAWAEITAGAGAGTVFGQAFQQVENTVPATTTTPGPVTFLNLTTPALLGGTYRIGWFYVWSYDNVTQDMLSQIMLDGSDALLGPDGHRQEPKDAGGAGTGGTNQRYILSGFAHRTFSAGVHTLDITYGSGGGQTAAIHLGRLELWRVA